jgi:hypothetical protein
MIEFQAAPMAPLGTPLTPMLPATAPALVQRITNQGVDFDMPRPNLLKNGGFEDWPTGPGPFDQPHQECAAGWLVYPNRFGEVPVITQEQPSTAPAGSLSCVRVSGSSAIANIVAQTIDPALCALNGVTVSLSVLCNAPVGSTVQAIVGILSNVGFQLPQPMAGTGDWQPLRMTCTLPDIPGPVLVALCGIGAYEFAFDNANLVVGSAPADYQPTTIAGGTGGQGSVGPQGPQGPQGAAGPPGPQGNQGVAGPMGSVGPQGPAGSQGPPGTAGLTGPAGTTGSQGPKGDPGATGPQGVQGLTGAAGAQGPQGIQGLTGLTGPQGIQGPSGVVQTVIATAADAQSSTATTPVIIPNSSLTIATTGGTVLLFANTSFNITGSTRIVYLSLFADNVLVSTAASATQTSGRVGLSSAWRLTPVAGSHTYALGWWASAGTLSTTTDAVRSLLAMEVKP